MFLLSFYVYKYRYFLYIFLYLLSSSLNCFCMEGSVEKENPFLDMSPNQIEELSKLIKLFENSWIHLNVLTELTTALHNSLPHISNVDNLSMEIDRSKNPIIHETSQAFVNDDFLFIGEKFSQHSRSLESEIITVLSHFATSTKDSIKQMLNGNIVDIETYLVEIFLTYRKFYGTSTALGYTLLGSIV